MDQSERDDLRQKITEAHKEALQLQQIQLYDDDCDDDICIDWPPTSTWCCDEVAS